jgi:UDP-glucose:(heptosyl)LPS alpha-1,3-glucosyltransferase
MKVALVLDNFLPGRGGVEQWTARFADWLTANGHDVSVVAERFDPAAVAWTGITPVELPRGLGRMARAEAAGEIAASLGADVVHDMGLGFRCDVLQPHGGAWLAAQERNLALLPNWQQSCKRFVAPLLPRYREFRRVVNRQYATDGPMVIALSKMVADDMRRFHNIAPDRMRLIYNGVDCDQFSPNHRTRHRDALRRELGVQESSTLFAIVAHNFRLKGVATLARAVARLKSEGADVHLVVAGGKRTGAYERLADRLGLAGRASFLGSINDPVPLYAAADVYVQPTFYDPCSLVVLEALASGLPTVTSRYNGAGELITRGREGAIIQDPADDLELTDTLRPYLDLEIRTEAGRAARQLALAHTLDRNASEVFSLYQDIAGRRRLAA